MDAAPHVWWPRPDVGPDVVRCTECATSTIEAKLSPEERAVVFAANVVRLFASLGRKRGELANFARGQWKVFADHRPREAQFEGNFLRAIDAAAAVILPEAVRNA
jgi:hypothetical protein